jgi:hypothetical protein
LNLPLNFQNNVKMAVQSSLPEMETENRSAVENGQNRTDVLRIFFFFNHCLSHILWNRVRVLIGILQAGTNKSGFVPSRITDVKYLERPISRSVTIEPINQLIPVSKQRRSALGYFFPMVGSNCTE